MDVIWRKVWRDLWHNKLRTFLIVLATTVGVAGLGIVFGLSGMMRARMTASHRTSSPPHLFLYTNRVDLLDQDFVEAVQREPDIAKTEGQASVDFRWKLQGETEWRDGNIFARHDYDQQNLYRIRLLEGQWPGRRMSLAIERMSAEYYNLPIGTTIIVEIGKKEYRLPVVGVVHHPYTEPPQFGGSATFCATMKTVAKLTGRASGFNSLYVLLESFSQEDARATAKRIENRVENDGMEISHWSIFEPDYHWAQEIVDVVLLILGVLGALSLGLSGFLIVNVTNATIVQQVWQIGVMKVVGATAGQVVRIYLITAAIYGLLALLVAVPLGAVAAQLLAIWLLNLFNIVLTDFEIVPVAIAIQVVMGLAVPMLAALVPALGAARITPHQAISSQGLGGGFGRSWLDRLLGEIRQLPRPLALSLRNTFRRKTRVGLTLLALTTGGIVFIMVSSVSTSFNSTLDTLSRDFGLDVLIKLKRMYRVTKLVEATQSVPGVDKAEVWNYHGGQLTLTTGEKLSVGLWGIPADSEIFNPRVVSGRPLLPEDDRAILLNNSIAVDEGFQVGDEIELTLNGDDSKWTVVGLVFSHRNNSKDNFVNFDALARETGNVNRGSQVVATFEENTSQTPEKLIEALRAVYDARYFDAVDFQSAMEVQIHDDEGLGAILILLMAMAVLVIIVGSTGLMSTMSINVVERSREIGVMRAIGATSFAIAGIFVFEGVSVGVLSWLLAIPLSYPGARAFSNLVGVQLLELPLEFSYPVGGIFLWLTIVVTISALVSLWPALRATKISVHESLTYE